MASAIDPSVLSELAPTGKVRVGLNYQNVLLVTSGAAGGEPRGPAPDLARELGRRLGLPLEFVGFNTAGQLADAVKSGAWDIAFLGAEPQREGEIAFTAAYLEIPATYLVPAGSELRSVADVDRDGVRIAAAEKSAYELFLRRSLTHAQLVTVQGIDASFQLFVTEELEALAGLRPRLLLDVEKLPGARVLDGQFTAVQQAIGTPRGRAAAARYLCDFVEDVKASVFMAEAIARNGVRGVSVAPPRAPR
jgi:polar amino acid transport system substrate-binding protein